VLVLGGGTVLVVLSKSTLTGLELSDDGGQLGLAGGVLATGLAWTRTVLALALLDLVGHIITIRLVLLSLIAASTTMMLLRMRDGDGAIDDHRLAQSGRGSRTKCHSSRAAMMTSGGRKDDGLLEHSTISRDGIVGVERHHGDVAGGGAAGAGINGGAVRGTSRVGATRSLLNQVDLIVQSILVGVD